MKRQWQLQRAAVQRSDAQQRWDQAYQSILKWSLETKQASDPSANGKEEYDADSGLRQGFEFPAGQAPDD